MDDQVRLGQQTEEIPSCIEKAHDCLSSCPENAFCASEVQGERLSIPLDLWPPKLLQQRQKSPHRQCKPTDNCFFLFTFFSLTSWIQLTQICHHCYRQTLIVKILLLTLIVKLQVIVNNIIPKQNQNSYPNSYCSSAHLVCVIAV